MRGIPDSGCKPIDPRIRNQPPTYRSAKWPVHTSAVDHRTVVGFRSASPGFLPVVAISSPVSSSSSFRVLVCLHAWGTFCGNLDNCAIADLSKALIYAPHCTTVAVENAVYRRGHSPEIPERLKITFACKIHETPPVSGRLANPFTGSPGRAPFCKWNGPSSLSHADLMEASHTALMRSERKR
jgi:hypothetical protein